MATIHMEVDSCRSTAAAIGNTKATLEEQVNSLAQNINGVVGSAWIAPSASEFQSAYQEWSGTMKSLLEQLASLQSRLNAEIADFEQAASKLN